MTVRKGSPRPLLKETAPLKLVMGRINQVGFLEPFFTIATAVVHTASSDYEGTPTETDEAIPYEEMWEDDKVWLPLMLQGKACSGRYLFDNDTMLDYQLE